MAKLTLREAARLFHVSRPTLKRALDRGKISGIRNDSGHWRIEVSELERVYQARGSDEAKKEANQTAEPTELERLRAENADQRARIEVLEVQVEAAEDKVRLQEDHISDLRKLLPGVASSRRRWRWPWE